MAFTLSKETIGFIKDSIGMSPIEKTFHSRSARGYIRISKKHS